MKNEKYTYRITWSEEDKQHVGVCIEFPSLSWLAATPEEALSGIRKTVNGVLRDMLKTGETPPEPLATRTFSGKFLVRVPPETHRRLVIEAQEENISLNRLVSSKLAKGA
jgi:predicted HicB family RNase H-like nuclease